MYSENEPPMISEPGAVYSPMSTETIRSITLDTKSIISRAEHIEREYEAAVRDLLKENSFDPAGFDKGPYDVALSIMDGRLRFMITSEAIDSKEEIKLDVRPLRRIIKDYFLMCDSYFQAIYSANTHKVEALDMGRRGVHNEGSERLHALLKDKISVDFETARRLFTLISILHIKQ